MAFLLVETQDGTVLLDTGSSYSVTHNADILGIDLAKIERVILSHDHSDHTGGLRSLLRRMKKRVEIIAHPDVWQSKYVRREGEQDRYIGIPFRRDELESLGAEFRPASQPLHIAEGIMTTGEIPMVTVFEQIDRGLFVKEGSVWKPDEVMDDQALVVKTERGLAVILGCAHRGIINTFYHARQITGTDRVHAVVGGAHLLHASEERLGRRLPP